MLFCLSRLQRSAGSLLLALLFALLSLTLAPQPEQRRGGREWLRGPVILENPD